jgi:drug/metabolite transporter (DMT)-like permease
MAAALSFGIADFCGAVVSRRATALSAALSVQLVGAAGLGAILVVTRTEPTLLAAGTGLAAGVAVGIGLFALYQAFFAGAIGIVAVLTGVVASALTFAYDTAFVGQVPSAVQVAGIGCAMAGAGLSARLGTITPRVAGMSVTAGMAFGASFILYNRAAGEDPVSVLFYARLAAIVLLGGIWAMRYPRRLTLRPLVAVAGILDTLANALMLNAVTLVPVSLATAISSANPPVIAMLLARLFLREALPRTAYLAVGLASLGIALMFLG